MIRVLGLVLLALFVGCTSTGDSQSQSPPLASPLAGLAAPHPGTTKHEGSWDRKGGNGDARSVAPGETLTLLDYQGAGVVHRFWVTIAPRAQMEIHRQAILRMYWDGESIPSVECPIGDFFGVGFGQQKDYISLPLNETSGGYNCYWPMPFHRSARWTITNLSDRKIDAFYYNIDFTGYDKLPTDLRHFHAQWRRENPTSPGKNYTILDTTGAGQFVGAALFMQARKPRGLGFLEGDEMIYVDGDSKPAVVGTGTEDYFSSGWYFDRGTYSAPFHGVIIKDEAQSRISAYRWHIEDAMPFKKSIRVTIEHGTNNDHEADYSSVAYYYMSGVNPPNPPLPTDPKDLLPAAPPVVKHFPGVIEGEALLETAKASDGPVEMQHMGPFGGEYSGEAQLWWRPQKAGESLSLNLPVEKAGNYDIVGYFTRAPDYAQVSIQLNDQQAKPIDLYAPRVEPSGPIPLGRVNLAAGAAKLNIRVTGKSDQSSNYLVGLDAIELRPAK
jgi:hypothetical protein